MEKDGLTSELKGQRTLATVVFTDCVGFSARMSINEDHTLDLIRRDLKLMKHLCEAYEGRVLKSTGDGLLMCFISAVKAVEYAVEVQKKLAENGNSLPSDDALKHRIGIHLADIFINETDVMGNGVNIAARLQTLADPGGICISQTVYDVVKAGLHMETCYLGPRELKNIREVVSVYKILLGPEADPTGLFAEVVHRLKQNRNVARIKKLLFYSCKSTWESNQSVMESFPLETLLQELLEVAPTAERLRFFLDSAVRTLSKPAEYSMVVNDIMGEMTRLYESLQSSRSKSTPSTPPDSSETVAVGIRNKPDPIYEQIAQELEQTGNLLRMKKLMFYVCRNRWENDQNVLKEVDLPHLIGEMHYLFPTLEQLRAIVNEFVHTLSKQAEYTLVANVLIGKLQKLYINRRIASSIHSIPGISSIDESVTTPFEDSDPQAQESAFESSAPTPESQEQSIYSNIANELESDPNLLRIKKLILYVCKQTWENDPNKLKTFKTDALIQEIHGLAVTRGQLTSALNTVVKSLNKREEYVPIAQTLIKKLGKLYSSPRFHQ